MKSQALGTYLNDHLAGATLGCDHARQLVELHEGTPFEPDMARIAAEIEEDRETLLELMERIGITPNPVKKAGAWIAEKAGRVKFTGQTQGDLAFGRYLSLEMMSLGVEGKLSLWMALERIGPSIDELADVTFSALAYRAESQRTVLERQRLRTAAMAFGADRLPVPA